MNVQAENALLKTLEEPSPDTLIILITGQPYLLLPTILSRCQHIKFQPLPDSIAAELIMEKGKVDSQTAALMVSLTGGSPGKALELKIDYFKELRDSWVDKSSPSLGAEGEGMFNLAEDFGSEKGKVNLKLNLLRLWYRDLILYKIYGNSDCLLNKDKADKIAIHSSFWSLEKLLNVLFWIEEYHQTIDRNVNPQLTMEALFMRLNPRSETGPKRFETFL
ncbi:MAG: hypothetical protein JRJ08_03055 [Deltaproteobacteria bacterium]|nr:hypothetical protein [Deltaproteobacteria bacterium]